MAAGRVDRAFASLARTMVRGRWVVIAAWIAAVAIVPQALPTLASKEKSQNADFLPKGTPSLHAADLAQPFQARNTFYVLLLAGRTAPLSGADNAAIDRAEAALARDPSVLDVRDQGPSADRQARKAQVEIRPTVRFDRYDQALKSMRRAMSSVARPPGLALHLGGALAQNVDRQAKDRSTRQLTQQLSVLFILVLLLLVFRAALAPLITLLPAGLSLAISGPLIAEATNIGVKVSNLTQILLTVIVLGAGTDYGLFLIYRVREEIARGATPREAVTTALSRVGETITFSALCVVFALLSLVLADFGLYRGLGPGLAIGIAAVLVAGLTLLPALLSVFGRVAFWPSRPRPGHEYRGAWGGVAARVIGRPRAILALGVVLFGGLALAGLAYTPAGFGNRPAPPGSDSAQGEQILDAHFPIAVRNPTNLVFRLARSAWSDPGIVSTAQRELHGLPALRSVTGALDPNGTPIAARRLTALYRSVGPPQALVRPGHAGGAGTTGVDVRTLAAYRATAQFVSADGRTIQFYATLAAGDPASTAALNAVPVVRRDVAGVARRIGAVDSGVAGQAPAAYDVSRTATSDLKRIVPVVLVIIALLLAVLLRSLVAPMYLIVSVVLSYLASLGLAVALFQGIAGDSGLNFVLPFFMFVFLMALGSDYNILVMTRIREEAASHPLREAVRRALSATGGTVTSAGLVLAGTFAVLTVAGDAQTQEIGFGLAAGILLDTFLVRTLLIPSLVVLLGRRNWWPSGMSRAEREVGPGA